MSEVEVAVFYNGFAGSGGGWHEKVLFASWPQFRTIVKKNRNTVARFEGGPNTEFVYIIYIYISYIVYVIHMTHYWTYFDLTSHPSRSAQAAYFLILRHATH